MIITVTDEIEIRECQTELSVILGSKLPQKGSYSYGDPEGTIPETFHYNEDMWWCIDQRECAKTGHVNLFGLGPPPIHTNEINLTMSIPLNGIN